MSRRWIKWYGCLLLLGGIVGISGCGSEAPSDRDIEAAIRKAYADKTFQTRMIHAEVFQIKEVRVLKRGKYFKKQRDSGPDEGYPVRVFVKGTVTEGPARFGLEGSTKPFEGERDFVMCYVPPDPSKVDPGSGEWVAGQ